MFLMVLRVIPRDSWMPFAPDATIIQRSSFARKLSQIWIEIQENLFP